MNLIKAWLYNEDGEPIAWSDATNNELRLLEMAIGRAVDEHVPEGRKWGFAVEFEHDDYATITFNRYAAAAAPRAIGEELRGQCIFVPGSGELFFS